jgi:hypothetical protein
MCHLQAQISNWSLHDILAPCKFFGIQNRTSKSYVSMHPKMKIIFKKASAYRSRSQLRIEENELGWILPSNEGSRVSAKVVTYIYIFNLSIEQLNNWTS